MTVAAVFIGGALGALLRALVGRIDEGAAFSWSTVAINIIGCLLIGLLAGRVRRHPPERAWIQPFLATGFLGGFTTMSAYAVHTWLLGSAGATGPAISYACLTLVGSIAAAHLGYAATAKEKA